MILVDRRQGSSALYAPLVARGLECRLVTLPFGDLAFAGNGPDGPVTVGIEHKQIRELIQSLMSGRLQGFQLPGCLKEYDHSWLLIEGAWRTSRTGGVEIRVAGEWASVQPYITGDSFAGWLLTVQLRGGMRVAHTRDHYDSVHWIERLYKWWTAKEWAKHRGHLALYQPPDVALFRVPTLVERVAALLPGVGEDKAQTVGTTFQTVLDMAMAGPGTWREIPGVGALIADRAVEALQGAEVAGASRKAHRAEIMARRVASRRRRALLKKAASER